MNTFSLYLKNSSLIIFVVVFLTGCFASTGEYGRKFETADIKKIKNGITTKADVLQIFGEPYSKSIHPNGENWMYYYKNIKSKLDPISIVPVVGSFAGKKHLSSEGSTLMLRFDKNTLKECSFSYSSLAGLVEKSVYS